MTEALINTLLGMGTVFVSLILISFIISLLKPLSDLILGVNKNTKKEVIIMGSGIACKRKVGQEIEEDKIEKIFVIDFENIDYFWLEELL